MTNPTCPHCGTAIEEHEANACLDKWVCETAMRKTPLRVYIVTSDGGKTAAAQFRSQREAQRWMEAHPDFLDRPRSVSFRDECPPYSTSIAAAWEVVEKMNSRGFWSDASRDPTGYVCCTFDSGKRVFISPKKTKDMPLAICRAAILAATQEDKA